MSTRPSYNNTLQYLYNLEKYGTMLGLERITALLKFLGNPQDKLNIIHIGGTNGKGSTSAMIASVLQKAGYKVGLYTSPHLSRFNERIRIDGREITDKRIVELIKRIRKTIRGNGETEKRRNGETKRPIPRFYSAPTFFEFTTAMAFLYFAEENVDIAVMEVGLGGRLDATNVCNPLVSIITNVAKDHEEMLGNRIRDIAFEKAGIIKNYGVLISAEAKPAVLKVLTAECKRKRTVFYRLNRDFFIDAKERGPGFKGSRVQGAMGSVSLDPWTPRPLFFKGRRWVLKDLKTNLLGKHQYFNAVCAIAALEVLEEKGYNISESAVRKGLQNVSWPGRLEVVSKRPFIVLDCAHNPAGAEVLRDALQNEFKYKRLFLVIGIMADKDMKGILSRLAPLAYRVVLTRPKVARAASLDLLYKKICTYANRIELIGDVKDACSFALSMTDANDMICISGSVFTVGEARDFFIHGGNEARQK